VVAQEVEYPHGEFEDDCTLCHRAEAWVPAEVSSDFDHAERGFALDGSHRQTQCRACHRSLEFADAENDCAGCHLDPHQSELGLNCERCHTSRSFIDRAGMVRSHAASRLPLDGAHRTVDCEDCHAPVAQGQMQFVNTAVECEQCHLDVYLATSDPDHQASGFSRQCEDCHTTRAWEPAFFSHGQLPAGAQCANCHLDAYLATSDPDHQASGFSQQCEDCHSTRGWRPASFDHNQIPAGTPCVNCHLDDFQSTVDPNHQAGAFPQDCELCHSTLSWIPASDGFNHDGSYFPIYSGKHKGKWSACSDCHMVPSSFSDFTCINCHEHDDPAASADDHQGVSGYAYNSQACYTCHPTGDS